LLREEVFSHFQNFQIGPEVWLFSGYHGHFFAWVKCPRHESEHLPWECMELYLDFHHMSSWCVLGQCFLYLHNLIDRADSWEFSVFVCLWFWACICIYSFIPLAYAECNDSLPFSVASSIPLCSLPFSSTLFHQLISHPPSLHLAIYFLVYLSAFVASKFIYNTFFKNNVFFHSLYMPKAYGSVMWRYPIPNKIFYMKMKIYKPLHSYPTLTY